MTVEQIASGSEQETKSSSASMAAVRLAPKVLLSGTAMGQPVKKAMVYLLPVKRYKRHGKVLLAGLKEKARCGLRKLKNLAIGSNHSKQQQQEEQLEEEDDNGILTVNLVSGNDDIEDDLMAAAVDLLHQEEEEQSKSMDNCIVLAIPCPSNGDSNMTSSASDLDDSIDAMPLAIIGNFHHSLH